MEILPHVSHVVRNGSKKMQQQEAIHAVMAPLDDDSIRSRILTIRGVQVILDRDIAILYGVETKALNQAVKRNRERFPDRFMFQLTEEELGNWKSQIVTSNPSLLKSKRATAAAFAIIETFAKVRGLKRELVELHKEGDKRRQADKMRHFGEALADIVMPDMDTVETESSLELNFFIGKIKHTVRRIRKVEKKD